MKIKVFAALGALLAATPALADGGMGGMGATPGFDWSGFRFGVHSGYFMGSALDDYTPGSSYTFPANGIFGGFHAGYDHAFGPIVVGLEAEFMWSTIHGDYSNATNTGSVDHHWAGSVNGRVGYAFGNTLLYVTGGINFSKVTTVAGPTGGPYDSDYLTFHSGLVPHYGKNLGFGVEHGFSHGVSAFVEYRYVFIGDESISLAPTFPGDSHFVSIGGSTVRVGVTLHLGGGGLGLGMGMH